MKCVICKTGEVTQAPVQAGVKAGYDQLLVNAKAEARAAAFSRRSARTT
jgi:hypothetical protein